MKASRCASMVATLALSAVGCKANRSSLESLSPSFATSPDGKLALTNKESQELYNLMRSKEEEAAGSKLPAGTMHNASALLHCGRQVAGAANIPCMVRVHIEAKDIMTQGQTVSPELAQTFWTFMRGGTSYLSEEPLIVADLQCTYIGKATPPYDVEDTRCSVQYPRRPGDSIVDAKVAEELANKLQGDSRFVGDAASVSGSLMCYLSEKSRESECVLRAIKDGLLQEKFLPVSGESAKVLHRALGRASRTLHEVLSTPGGHEPYTAPEEFMSSLTCGVDIQKMRSPGHGYAICRLSL